ncbi:MAG: hypothetical protein GY934_07245, partial [Gammaproteobacteria bacterium]|nr:hypothetical protein [Gammaproteobacteria bacterium]
FTVYIDDNFHHGDEDERYKLGEYESYEDAVAACKKAVGINLLELYQAGMTPAALYCAYTSFGEDPFIMPSVGNDRFSAWNYAQDHCAEICAAKLIQLSNVKAVAGTGSGKTGATSKKPLRNLKVSSVSSDHPIYSHGIVVGGKRLDGSKRTTGISSGKPTINQETQRLLDEHQRELAEAIPHQFGQTAQSSLPTEEEPDNSES